MASSQYDLIMIASTVSISQPAHLSLAKGQLQISLKTSGVIDTIPIDSLGYLILDHPQITLTHALLAKLGTYQVATVICDSKHLPISLTLPLYGHHLSQERFHHQLNAPLPLKKQLWKRVIIQKIDHQSLLLKEKQALATYRLLQQFKSEVRSGDSSQKEAQAAKHYWKALFGSAFFRDPKREDFYNLALNYGYAILRAMVARALIGSGLLPFAGIHHHNRYNPYCLADDIMEPYRPWVDRYLYHLQLPQRAAPTQLSKEERAQLLEIPYLACHTKEGQSQLDIGIAQTTASLAKVYYTQNHRLITFPSLPCDEKKKKRNTKKN